MIKLKEPYTDAYGVTHSAAIIVINTVNYETRRNVGLVIDAQDQTRQTFTTTNDNEYGQVGFTAHLYTNEQAMLAGKQPMQLKNSSGMDWFSTIAPQNLDTTEIINLCEQHILETVILEK